MLYKTNIYLKNIKYIFKFLNIFFTYNNLSLIIFHISIIIFKYNSLPIIFYLKFF